MPTLVTASLEVSAFQSTSWILFPTCRLYPAPPCQSPPSPVGTAKCPASADRMAHPLRDRSRGTGNTAAPDTRHRSPQVTKDHRRSPLGRHHISGVSGVSRHPSRVTGWQRSLQATPGSPLPRHGSLRGRAGPAEVTQCRHDQPRRKAPFFRLTALPTKDTIHRQQSCVLPRRSPLPGPTRRLSKGLMATVRRAGRRAEPPGCFGKAVWPRLEPPEPIYGDSTGLRAGARRLER